MSQVKAQALQVMKQLEGWCTDNKACILMDFVKLLKPKVCVEIGVFGGKSLVPLAMAVKDEHCGVVHGIDPWKTEYSVYGWDDNIKNKEWWKNIDHQKILDGLLAKIHKYDLQDIILLHRTSSAEAKLISNIDILHIDGNHCEETSVLDVQKWVPCVNKGGLIIFDDIDWETTKKATTLLETMAVRLTTIREGNMWGIWVKM